MKILISGGAGFLGINLVRYLLKAGNYQLVSLDLCEFNYPEKKRVTALRGDIRDRAAVRQAMAQTAVVIHTAAALPLYKKSDIYSTDVEGTRILLEEAKLAGVKRFIHISSTAVYGIPDHHPLREDDRLFGVGDYGAAKIMAEKLCEQYRAGGMCVPILRPKSFIGPERLGVFALLFDWALSKKNFPLLGNGKNRYQLLDVEDLCTAIYLCLSGEEKMVNDTFNIGAKEFATMREDYQAVLDAAGFGKRIIPFPSRPLIVLLRFLERLKLSPLYAWVYETAHTDSFVSLAKAEQKLQFKPRYSNQQALVRNFIWYRENLAHFKNSSGISHRVPWKQGVLKLAKIFF